MVSLKHLNIMVSGCRQLFLGDIDTGSLAFEPLHRYLVDAVVLQYSGSHGGDNGADPGGDSGGGMNEKNHQLLGLCASFLPYYTDDDGTFLSVFDRIASATNPNAISTNATTNLPATQTTNPSTTTPPTSEAQFLAVDFAVGRAVDALSKDVRSDNAATKYLHRLASLKALVKDLRLSTRIRLQGVIYSLTQPGGPRYASTDVNRLAFQTLDELFPHGKRTRRAINFGFRGLFVFSRVTGAMYYAYIRAWMFFFAVFRAIVNAFKWRKR